MEFSLLETQTEIPTEHRNIVVSGAKYHNRNPNPDTTPQSFHTDKPPTLHHNPSTNY
jgi:hypothetical protein